ncbi:hypothetical protein BH23ACT2_BH23ACT2_14980 [soil metagenome]
MADCPHGKPRSGRSEEVSGVRTVPRVMLPRRLRESRRLLEVCLALTQVLGLVTSVVLARTLGPAGRGTITTLTVWAQVLMRTACLDMDRAIAVVSRLDGLAPHATYRRARRIVWQIALPASGVAAGLYLAATGSPMLGAALALAILAGARFEVSMGLLLATGELATFALRRLVQPVAYAAGAGALLLWRAVADPGEQVLVATAAALFAASLVVAAVLSNPRPGAPELSDRVPPLVRRRLVVFGAKSQAVSLAQFLNGRLDLILVGLLLTATDVGLYAVATVAGAALVFLGAAGFTRGLSGETSTFDARGLLAVIAMAALGIVAAPWALTLVFGNDFADAAPSARILLIGGIFGYLAATVSGRLIGLGAPVRASVAQSLGVLTLTVIAVLGPRSIEAVAVASSLGYAATALAGHVLERSATTPAAGVDEAP